MNNTMRTLVVLAGLTALAVPSQAVITFSSFTSDFTVDPGASNQIDATPTQLSNFVFGAGTVTDSGHFDVSGTNGLTDLLVNEVDGFANAGTLSLIVTLYSGTTIGSAPLQVLYTGSVTNGLLVPTATDNPLAPALTGTHAVGYVATFTGTGSGSTGYLGGMAVDAFEAVPEPMSFAAVGIGVIGLIARRRRSGK